MSYSVSSECSLCHRLQLILCLLIWAWINFPVPGEVEEVRCEVWGQIRQVPGPVVLPAQGELNVQLLSRYLCYIASARKKPLACGNGTPACDLSEVSGRALSHYRYNITDLVTHSWLSSLCARGGFSLWMEKFVSWPVLNWLLIFISVITVCFSSRFTGSPSSTPSWWSFSWWVWYPWFWWGHYERITPDTAKRRKWMTWYAFCFLTKTLSRVKIQLLSLA